MNEVMAAAEKMGAAEMVREALAQHGQAPEVFFRFFKADLNWASNNAAGRCDLNDAYRVLTAGGTIRVNRALAGDPAEQRATFLHEVAHAVAEWKAAGSDELANHGPVWQAVARAMGVSDSPQATAEVSALIRGFNRATGVTKVVAECSICDWKLYRRRFSKKNYAKDYSCPRCGGVLDNAPGQGGR